jgi:hypothetical protein
MLVVQSVLPEVPFFSLVDAKYSIDCYLAQPDRKALCPPAPPQLSKLAYLPPLCNQISIHSGPALRHFFVVQAFNTLRQDALSVLSHPLSP